VMGAKLITLNIPISAAKRVAPLVDKSAFTIGLLGSPNMSSTNTDAIARPEQFEQAVSFSKNYGMSFDIGDATGGGYDALKFVADHHDRIALLYIKDRRKTGESVPFGEGDAPIGQVLRLIRDRKSPIPCYLDCDYRTTNRAADVKRSFEYVKAALEAKEKTR
jgi:sugar phosphate isomerase/epimerase